MTNIKHEKVILVLVIVAAALLRLWGIGFGLPYQFHQDEPIVVNHALAYGTGDLNPHFFIIPPLTSYILFFFYGIYFVILKIAGLLKETGSFAVLFFRDPTYFYLTGRFVAGLVPSIASVYLTYRLAIKIFSKKAALYSSLVMAVAFLNVVNAHYIYTDSLLVFFVLLSIFRFYMIIEKPVTRNYILAGLSTGIAIATKYNAAVLIATFLTAHYIAMGRKMRLTLLSGKAFLYLVAATLSFIIFNPFAVLDYRFFILSMMTRIAPGYIGASHHIIHSLFEGVGAIPSILGISGLILSLFRKPKPVNFFIIVYPLIFYIHLVFMSQPHSRYALSLIPFIAMGLGFLLFDYVYPKIVSKGARVSFLLIAAIILIPTAAKSVKADLLFTIKDTRAEAAYWIETNIPPLAKIAFDNTSFRPQIKNTVSQMKEKLSILDKQPELKDLKSKKIDFQIKALEGEKTYEIYYLAEGDENKGQFLNLWPMIENSIDELKRYKIEYVVFNNMTNSQSMKDLHKKIAEDYALVAEFNPYKEAAFRKPYDEIETTCMPIKSKELFSRVQPGPYIKIYKLRR